jgi:homogentisate phytyltransferase/homogentisate geranylgeranyltransferase
LGIAWFKDIPDTAGDAQFQYGTLAVQQGRNPAFRLGVMVVSLAYAGVIGAALAGWLPSVLFFVCTHTLLLCTFLYMAWRLNVQDDRAVKRFYLFFWGLFFVEYLVYPLGFLL